MIRRGDVYFAKDGRRYFETTDSSHWVNFPKFYAYFVKIDAIKPNNVLDYTSGFMSRGTYQIHCRTYTSLDDIAYHGLLNEIRNGHLILEVDGFFNQFSNQSSQESQNTST